MAAGLTAAAVAADPADPADAGAGKTAQTKAEDRGWFSRINPFSPLIKPDGTKETGPKPPPEGTAGEGTPGAVGTSETSQTQDDKAGDAAQSTVPVLNGILFSDRLVIAIVSDAIAKTGDLLDGFRITSITHDTVVAEKGDRRYIMTTRRPQAQLEMLRPPAADKTTNPAAPGNNLEETPSSELPETADTIGAGPDAPVTGASESTRTAPDRAK